MQSIAPGLLRWTAPHPQWRGADVEPDDPLDWPREVGCVAAVVDGRAVLIDPLVDGDWSALDAFAAGREVVVLTTLRYHVRSAEAAVERFGAGTGPPEGVEAIEVPHAAERVFWLPSHGALVPGDCLLNRPRDPGLRVMPQPWLEFVPGSATVAQVAAELRPLLELPIEHVLVSHGEPVVGGGREALAAAIATAESTVA